VEREEAEKEQEEKASSELGERLRERGVTGRSTKLRTLKTGREQKQRAELPSNASRKKRKLPGSCGAACGCRSSGCCVILLARSS
jgi:hypothetical protein